MSQLSDRQDLVDCLGTISDRELFTQTFRLARLPNMKLHYGHSAPPCDQTVGGTVNLESEEAQSNGHRRYWGFNNDDPSIYIDEIHSINDSGWIARTVPFASTESTPEHSLPAPAKPEETLGYVIAAGRRQSNACAVSLTFDDANIVEGLHTYVVVSFLNALANGADPTSDALDDLEKLCDRLGIRHCTDPRFL